MRISLNNWKLYNCSTSICFITMFTKVRHWTLPWATSVQFTSAHAIFLICILNSFFRLYMPQELSCPEVLQPKFCVLHGFPSLLYLTTMLICRLIRVYLSVFVELNRDFHKTEADVKVKLTSCVKHTSMKVYKGRGGSYIPDLDSRWRWVCQRHALPTHWMRGWVGSMPDLDVVVKSKNRFSSGNRTPVVQLRAF